MHSWSGVLVAKQKVLQLTEVHQTTLNNNLNSLIMLEIGRGAQHEPTIKVY